MIFFQIMFVDLVLKATTVNRISIIIVMIFNQFLENQIKL